MPSALLSLLTLLLALPTNLSLFVVVVVAVVAVVVVVVALGVEGEGMGGKWTLIDWMADCAASVDRLVRPFFSSLTLLSPAGSLSPCLTGVDKTVRPSSDLAESPLLALSSRRSR